MKISPNVRQIACTNAAVVFGLTYVMVRVAIHLTLMSLHNIVPGLSENRLVAIAALVVSGLVPLLFAYLEYVIMVRKGLRGQQTQGRHDVQDVDNFDENENDDALR